MQFFAEAGKDPFRLLPLVAATFPKGTAFGGGGKVSGSEFYGTMDEARKVFEQALEKYKPLLNAKG